MTKLIEAKGILPEGAVWRPSLLYGIAGTICTLTVDNAAFAGYFRWDQKDKLVLDGQLIDCWGSSTIEGKLTSEEFEFVKIYDNRNDEIFYKFKKDKGLWIGEYDGINTGKGTAKCRLYVVSRDAFQIACGNPHRPPGSVNLCPE